MAHKKFKEIIGKVSKKSSQYRKKHPKISWASALKHVAKKLMHG